MIKNGNDKSLQFGHRARLRQKFLDGQMAEYEFLELLLTYAIPRRDVRALSRRLYNKYQGINNLLSESFESLIKNEGVKENTATFLKLIHKVTELSYKENLESGPIFHDYSKLENYCRALVFGKEVEEIHVFYLDSQYKLIKDKLHSRGTIDWAAMYVREIVKEALNLNASNIVLLHNHPAQTVCFSSEDIFLTQSLESTLEQVKIKLYDHLLVSGDIVYSMRNMHLLDKSSK